LCLFPHHLTHTHLSPTPPLPAADIDATGIHFLDDLLDELKEDGIQLVLGNPSQQVLLALKRAHLDRKLNPRNIHVHVADAVVRAQALVDAAVRKENVEGV